MNFPHLPVSATVISIGQDKVLNQDLYFGVPEIQMGDKFASQTAGSCLLGIDDGLCSSRACLKLQTVITLNV